MGERALSTSSFASSKDTFLLLSGTKRAELIASKEQLDGIKLIHEMLGSLRAVDMIPQLLSMLEKTTNNEDLLVRIKDWAALMKQ